MDLRKIISKRLDFNSEQKFNFGKLAFLSALGWTILVTPLVFVSSLTNCKIDLRQLKCNLNDQLQQYYAGLRNSRWAISRFAYLKHHLSDKSRNLVASLGEVFLPGFSFGNQSEFFFLRDLEGNTKFEVVRGALVDRRSSLFIPDEKNLTAFREKFVVTPCKVEQEIYVCLISTPGTREYLTKNERYFAVAAIARDELFRLSKAPDVQKNSLFRNDQPGFHLSLDPKNAEKPVFSGLENLLRQAEQFSPGIWISLSYPWSDFFFLVVFWIAGLTTLVAVLVSTARSFILTKAKHHIEKELFDKQKENIENTQRIIRGVIHDIKSPLVTLKFLSDTVKDPTDKAIVDLLVKRIHLIVNDLESKSCADRSEEFSALPIIPILSSIVLEKQKELGKKASICFSYDPRNVVFVNGVFSSFCRMISNIINNSAEASDGHVSIDIKVSSSKEGDTINISLQDNGKGIPAYVLNQLFQEGATFDKEGGSGLGLFQAKNTARSMGGTIRIFSEVGVGTRVEIELRPQKQPIWFRSLVCIKPGDPIVLIDDEESFGSSLKERIKGFSNQLSTVNFTHPSLVPSHFLKNPRSFFIVDNNFGDDLSRGLEFCSLLPADRTILLTSDWNLRKVQKAAEELKIGPLGKEFIQHLKFIKN